MNLDVATLVSAFFIYAGYKFYKMLMRDVNRLHKAEKQYKEKMRNMRGNGSL